MANAGVRFVVASEQQMLRLNAGAGVLDAESAMLGIVVQGYATSIERFGRRLRCLAKSRVMGKIRVVSSMDCAFSA